MAGSTVRALAILCIFAASPATAQVYPARPITMVVPFAPGGPLDTIGRILAEGMRASLGQPIIVENVAGAGGSIAVGRAARAAADGYTLSYGGWGTHVVTGATYALPFDLLSDLQPVALTSSVPWLIVAKSALPATDLAGLIAWLKANPDAATAGTAGVGSPGHIGAVFFQNATGTRFRFVPYRGSAPALQDLLAGQFDFMIDSPVTCLPQSRAGRIKVFAVAGKSRLTVAPDIPTVDEAGLPGFYMPVWQALWVPKATPKDIVGKLNAAVVETLADPAVRRRLAELGQEAVPREQQTSEALGAFHKAEIEKWWPIIKAANIKGE